MSKPRFTLSDLLLWISLAGLIAAVIAPMYRSMRRSATGDFVRALAISDDGGAAAALFGDGTVRVWKTADGSLMATLQSAAGSEPSVPYHAAGISILAISADGKTIAVALQARNTPASVIEVWDAANQKVVATLAAPSHCNVALAPGGDRVAWSAPRAAGLYGPSLGVSPGVALVGSPKWLPSDCAPVFSPDGQLVALRNDAGKIVLFETSTGRMQAELDIRLPPSQVSMAFSADGSKLIAMLDGMYCEFQADAAIRKGWDFSNSRRKSANVVGLTFATSIALLPGDRNLAVIDAFQTLSFIDLRTGEIREAGAAQYLAAARRGNVFVTSDGDRIDVWDAAEQAVRQSLWDQSSHVPRLVLFAVFLMWVVIYSHRKARKRLRPCAICGQPFVPQKKQSDVLECEKCRRRV
ncbi:MAG TPA: hypothetical protein VFW87_11515, partial [Pirellulales bacterium]|nr:hypothetical protein [Pirellulales bacterium]